MDFDPIYFLESFPKILPFFTNHIIFSINIISHINCWRTSISTDSKSQYSSYKTIGFIIYIILPVDSKFGTTLSNLLWLATIDTRYESY
ncbi:Uncharacterised protein [Staphylococcus gallinarum]|uniref:Uncharacterized protein n=1 Tax=Staphylococcus gallinarum TaxID=1293 RepID=A0A380FBB0_STAGA|nr:Uncharacterised protein [Staphylococcus gallinarum]